MYDMSLFSIFICIRLWKEGGEYIIMNRLVIALNNHTLFTNHPKLNSILPPINHRKNVNPFYMKGPVPRQSMPLLKLFSTIVTIDFPLKIQMRLSSVVPLDIRRMNSSYNVNVLRRMKL